MLLGTSESPGHRCWGGAQVDSREWSPRQAHHVRGAQGSAVWTAVGRRGAGRQDPRGQLLPGVLVPVALQRRLALGDRAQCPSVPWERSWGKWLLSTSGLPGRVQLGAANLAAQAVPHRPPQGAKGGPHWTGGKNVVGHMPWEKSPYIHHGKSQKKKHLAGKWVYRAVYED